MVMCGVFFAVRPEFLNMIGRAFVRILCVCCPRRMRRRYQPALRSKPSQYSFVTVKDIYSISSVDKQKQTKKFVGKQSQHAEEIPVRAILFIAVLSTSSHAPPPSQQRGRMRRADIHLTIALTVTAINNKDYRRFKGASVIALLTEAGNISETSVNVFQTARRNISEVSHLYARSHENLEYYGTSVLQSNKPAAINYSSVNQHELYSM
ncbi:Dopamine receptor 2 [Zootermopsis nevadensis]|uniref:Dopamine receptor 2 n=1 Tax=Zootermopsis nevadensis TaxID=136037 RepID=A0A067RL59_ZOONE|nr:Dopamine receptor 2 [Zootermopsis nevadensis]